MKKLMCLFITLLLCSCGVTFDDYVYQEPVIVEVGPYRPIYRPIYRSTIRPIPNQIFQPRLKPIMPPPGQPNGRIGRHK